MGSFGRKGDDQLRAQDDSLKEAAFGQLTEMYNEYARMAGEDGYFNNKMKQLRSDAEAKTQSIKDQNELSRNQQQQSFDQGVSTGQIAYQQALAGTRSSIDNMMKKSQMEASGARDTAAQDAFSVMMAGAKGGMAGSGERARRALAKKRSASTDAIALGLRLQKESAENSLAQAEQKISSDRSASALAMSQANEAADFSMNQQRGEVGRKLVTDLGEVEEARDKALANISEKAHQIKSSTVMSFKDQHTTWAGDDDAAGGNKYDKSGHHWDQKSTHDSFRKEFEKIDIA